MISAALADEIEEKMRPVGQVVKTEASHAFNIGSNPVRVTTRKSKSKDLLFFLPIGPFFLYVLLTRRAGTFLVYCFQFTTKEESRSYGY